MFEGKNTEFKREYTDEIKRTIIAFANTDGGETFIGVEDDGRVCGGQISVMLQATNSVRDAIRPDLSMFVDCPAADRGGKKAVRVQILRGSSRPSYLHGKGIRPEGVGRAPERRDGAGRGVYSSAPEERNA